MISPSNNPEVETRLDDETERTIGAFDLAARRSPFTIHTAEYQEALNALRFRIRELVEEARKAGQESGYIAAKAEVAAELIRQGATGSIRV
jgi:hypothetical protein